MPAQMKPCEAFLRGLSWHWLLAGLLTPSPSKPLWGRSLSIIPPGCLFLNRVFFEPVANWRLFDLSAAHLALRSFNDAQLIPRAVLVVIHRSSVRSFLDSSPAGWGFRFETNKQKKITPTWLSWKQAAWVRQWSQAWWEQRQAWELEDTGWEKIKIVWNSIEE